METTENIKNEIISKYMEHVLKHGETPKSIFIFSKELEIEEKTFYDYYSSFEHVANDVYVTFYNETIKLISHDETYEELDSKNKLLAFYFTFFELLTANRTYVNITLKDHKNLIDKFKIINQLKSHFKNFIKSLDIETMDFKKEELNNINRKSLEELAWKQFLFTLQFWLDDTSKSFEKTDLFIEKSVNASFDLLAISPLKSIIDFGKFFFKEKIKPNL